MQENILIPISDDKQIYGVLTSQSAETSKVIIFIHGFTGSKNEQHFYNAAGFFNPKGFATFRFNLYGEEKDAQKSSTVSLTDHITDTNCVIDYFSTKFKEIYLVGHSLGGCVATLANQANVSKIVLWDPSNGFKSPESKGMRWTQELNAYLCDKRMNVLFGKDLIEGWMNLNTDEMTSSIKVPVKFIFAGNYNKFEIWKPLLDNIKVAHSYTIIDGATHTFSEENKTLELYVETYEWIR